MSTRRAHPPKAKPRFYLVHMASWQPFCNFICSMLNKKHENHMKPYVQKGTVMCIKKMLTVGNMRYNVREEPGVLCPAGEALPVLDCSSTEVC